jgi:hypothetical protein
VVHWHVYPVCLWFLWPRRLGLFIWYVTCTQIGRAAPSDPWTGNLAYYWQCLTHDYHTSLASLVVVVALVALAVLLRRRREPASLAVVIFVAVAALLTNYHSANRSRFLHSWWAVTWVVAGVGAAGCLEWLVDHSLSRLARRMVPAAVCAALVGVACLQGAALVAPGHSEEGGVKPAQPNLLSLTDSVLPELADARHPAVISDPPFHLLLDWRRGERQRHRKGFLTPPRALLTAPAPGQLDVWLEQSSCDVVLLIDAPCSPDAMPAPAVATGQVRNLLASSGKFVLASQRHFPALGNVTVEVWRPAPGQMARR